ncbi:MAG: adenylyl-sulfate kinase [Oscillospiraceae bacterium]|nr:adenylyl-sulfate kinase [Oscillospiraceae bacterium]
MAYYLDEINERAKTDPAGFIEECDDTYNQKIRLAANMITENLPKSPIVLLSGPSGSGKTTTAMKIEEELKKRGVGVYSVAMDNYFRPKMIAEEMPRTPDGAIDFESPLIMDMDLLNTHFSMLSRGETVLVPKFDFSRQIRIVEPSKTLRLKKDEIAIFEGIHALNDDITGMHPDAFKLYISARSDVMNGDDLCFKGTWMRLVRRCVRDKLFRGMDVNVTLGMWANVRRGEKLYISPYKDKANIKFDSSFRYEVPVFKSLAADLFANLPDGIERFEELRSVIPAFELFESVDPGLLKPDSLLREFVGGGIYEY